MAEIDRHGQRHAVLHHPVTHTGAADHHLSDPLDRYGHVHAPVQKLRDADHEVRLPALHPVHKMMPPIRLVHLLRVGIRSLHVLPIVL